MLTKVQLLKLASALFFGVTFSSCAHHRAFGRAGADQRLDAIAIDYLMAKGANKDTSAFSRKLEFLALEFPQNVRVLYANAVLAYDNKEMANAQGYLDRLFSLQAIHPSAAILRARVAIEDGNLPFAKKLIQDHIKNVPSHAGLREMHAAIAFLQKDYKRAKSSLEMAAKLGANPAVAKYHLGLIAESEGNKEEAKEQYQQALASEAPFLRAKDRLDGLDIAAP